MISISDKSNFEGRGSLMLGSVFFYCPAFPTTVREEVAGQVKVGLKFFYKVQKLAIISLGTVTDL